MGQVQRLRSQILLKHRASKLIQTNQCWTHRYYCMITVATLTHQPYPSRRINSHKLIDVLQNKSVGIQTSESYSTSDVSENNDVSSNITCEKTTSTAFIPFLTIEDIKQDISFYTDLPNKETFYLLFEHLSVYYKCEVSDVLGCV